MPLLSEWKPSGPIQILVYGVSKVGKTWGALTAPRPVVLDYDNGIATGRNPLFVEKYGLREIFYETFLERDMVKGVPRTHNAYDDSCRFFDEWMKPVGKWKGVAVGRDMFDTWIIDSGTCLSELAQNKAVILLGGMRLSKSHEEALKSGLVIPKIQDYGAERSLTEQFVDMVRDSGKNLILICHEKEVVNEAGVTTAIVPLLTGKSSELVPLKFDEVYNVRVRKHGPEMIRYLQTQPDGIRKVGTRYGIPDGSQWDWNTVQAELNKIRSAQLGQLTQTKKE